MMRCAFALGTALAVCGIGFEATCAEVEEPPAGPSSENVQRLAERVDEMERSRAEDQRRIRELEEQLEADRSGDESDEASFLEAEAPDSAGSAATGQGNLLNPAITAFLDMGGSWSSDEDNQARNRFTLREAELDFRAAVTPHADGVLIVAIGEEIKDPFGDVETGWEFDVEEGFLDVHTLPWDLALKAGKFRAGFGRNNLLHTHDLPQVTRPLAVQAFLGPEGLATVGASLSWLVPNPWDRYVELSAQLVNADGGSESPILIGPAGKNPAVLSHLKLFQDVGDTGSLELGTSFLYSRASGDFGDSYVLGADATYMWRDPQKPDFRSLLIQGEFFWSKNDSRDEAGGIVHDDNWGAYVFAQYQFAKAWYAGIRYDYTGFPNLEERRRGDSDRAISPYVTWYPYEAVRLRLEYQHRDRDQMGRDDTEDAIFLGLTFYIGAHPPHPYWVNR